MSHQEAFSLQLLATALATAQATRCITIARLRAASWTRQREPWAAGAGKQVAPEECLLRLEGTHCYRPGLSGPRQGWFGLKVLECLEHMGSKKMLLLVQEAVESMVKWMSLDQASSDS